ncbi:MAG: ABC transporter permease, partial [Bacteroidota bacterium]
MFKNYFKIAIRSLLKNSVYSFINIAGLSIGLACSILILLWVWDEVTFNQYFPNYKNMYKMRLNAKVDKGIETGDAMAFPLRDVLLQQDSRIKNVIVTNWGEGGLLGVGDKKLNKVGLWATESFLSSFGFTMLHGDATTALKDPSSIVLSKATAIALFGDVDPTNKVIRVDDATDLRVVGVYEDLPDNTSFERLDFVIPFAHYEATQSWVRRSKENWKNHSFQMYVELQPGADMAEVNSSIAGLESTHNPDAKGIVELFLHPMDHWHLYSRFENGKEAGGMIEYVRLFSIIALFVLVIACINFMNLATARSESRAREVGIRKSIGSRRKDLVFQFLGESIFISFVAFLAAVLLVEVSLPFYNSIVSKHLQIEYTNPYLWLGALAIVLITGTLSGSYPALYLSSFHPVKVLKGRIKLGRNAATPRQILVTLQFGFSILLMAGTVVIYQQIQHVRSRDVGYNRENLLLFWTTTDIEKNYNALKNDLINSGVVESVCKSNSPITSIFSTNELQ